MKVLLLISRFDQTGMTTNTLDLYNGLRKFNANGRVQSNFFPNHLENP